MTSESEAEAEGCGVTVSTKAVMVEETSLSLLLSVWNSVIGLLDIVVVESMVFQKIRLLI